eukprot:TRINITY_DN5748_c0_g1_i2.p1 TRINITY_DN5748_c0_g1~~TRINITY_DN5748_c0_g1_i2.p1  ORF type:complete len:142 (+),score=30.95 TRINITY_DN5748_c0_g1_i2:68-493(+)
MAQRFPHIRPQAAAQPHTTTSDQARGTHDALRDGLHAQKDTFAAQHPIETVQNERIAHEENLKLSLLSSIQGDYMRSCIQLERSLLAQHQRLPTLHSSMLGLEVSMGLDSTISFEDYLGDVRDAEEMGDVHTMAQANPLFS